MFFYSNKNKRIFSSFCLVFLFITIILNNGCKNDTSDIQIQLRVRASFRSGGTDTIQAKVFVEGTDGNAVSAAVVTVRDSLNTVTQLEYNLSAHSYNGTLEEPQGNTNYIVEVSTVLSGNIIMLTVPFSKLANAPIVTVFQDASGNSVLHGQSLISAQPIQIGWADSGEGAVYHVSLRTMLRTVYAVSTEARTVTLPPNTVPSGSYLLEISAQKTHGDIYFRTAPYSSTSFLTAPMVSCNVN